MGRALCKFSERLNECMVDIHLKPYRYDTSITARCIAISVNAIYIDLFYVIDNKMGLQSLSLFTVHLEWDIRKS